MNNCQIVGQVTKAKIDTAPSGKRVGKVRVEVRRKYMEKVFTTRFDVQVYGQDAEFAGSLQPGTLVWASGEVGAYANEHNGKTYANLQLTGRIGVVEQGSAPQAPAPRQNAPAAPTQTTQSTAPIAGVHAAEDDSSDIPF